MYEFIPRGNDMKVFLLGLIAVVAFGMDANAGVKITETEQITIVEKFYISPKARKVAPRPCAKKAGEPVRVKTHTEIIDYYQVYQPVTVYKPMGTQIQRRVVPAKKCAKCGF